MKKVLSYIISSLLLLLFTLILLEFFTPQFAKAESFNTESMPISEVVRNVATIYNDKVIYQSTRKDLISFEIKPDETRQDVYMKLAMLLVEYGIDFIQEDNTIYFRDFNSDLPTTNIKTESFNNSALTTFKYRVKNSDSAQFVKSVKSIFTDSETVANTALDNTIIVTVHTQRKSQVKQLLKSLDKEQIDFADLKDRTIKLSGASPQLISNLIKTSFGSQYKYTFNESNTLLYIRISDDDFQRFKQLLTQFDKVKRQVLVDVIIAEMTTGRATELGRQLAYTGGSLQGVIKYPAINNVLGQGISALSTGLVLSFVKDKFSFILENIQTDASTNILSTPSLMTKEGYQASLVVGQSVPFKTGTFTSTGDGSSPDNPFTTIERHDVGIKLSFTPRILADGTIDLLLNQELSSVAQSSTGASDLITNKRQLTTNVIVENNDIIVLGGLVQTSKLITKNTSPLLSSIPLLGKLFKQSRNDYSSTNLMIFIRPRIMTADSDHNRRLIQKYIGSQNFNVQAKKTIKPQVKITKVGKPTPESSEFEHDFF